MSIQSAIEFTTAALKDSSLVAELSRVTAGKSPERAAEAFVQLGKSKGYDFTLEEATQVRLGLTQVASKLSEAELDKVAGGAGSNNMSQIVNQQVLQAVFSKGFGQLVSGPAANVLGAGAGAATVTAVQGGSFNDCMFAFLDAAGSVGPSTWNTIESVFSGW